MQGQGSREGLTPGKPQSHCSPGSTNIFPQTLAIEQTGQPFKEAAAHPTQEGFSRACRLQLLKFKPGRKLGMTARRLGLRTCPCPFSLHPAATHSVEASMMQLLLRRLDPDRASCSQESWPRPRLCPSSWAIEEATPRMLVEWSCHWEDSPGRAPA